MRLTASKGPKSLDLHLGLEPEPLGLFETTPETVSFFDELNRQERWEGFVILNAGINYDCCYLAVEFEEAQEGLNLLDQEGIRLSKLHLSSALRVKPSPENLRSLSRFVEEVYLHQVIVGRNGRILRRHKDLDLALSFVHLNQESLGDEWRIHFRVPLHASPGNGMEDTRDHASKTLDWLVGTRKMQAFGNGNLHLGSFAPKTCSQEVAQQVAEEYFWTLDTLRKRGLVQSATHSTT